MKRSKSNLLGELQLAFPNFHVRHVEPGVYRVCLVVQSCLELEPKIATRAIGFEETRGWIESLLHVGMEQLLKEKYGDYEDLLVVCGEMVDLLDSIQEHGVPLLRGDFWPLHDRMKVALREARGGQT